jgi:hypothetical protein
MLTLNGPPVTAHEDHAECVMVHEIRACDSKAITTTRWRNNSPTPLVSGIAPGEPIVELWDTKIGPETVVQYTLPEFRDFLATVAHRRPYTSHCYMVGGIEIDRDAWAAFRAGVTAGEFATV